MIFIKLVFWVSVFLVAYCYVIYGMLLWAMLTIRRSFIKKRFHYNGNDLPAVTLIVAIYNEEEVIGEKIRNTLALSYPEEKLNVIFITDGSTDSTNDIIRQYDRITLLHEPSRRGKIMAMNRAMAYVTTPVVVFCDANTLLNADCIRQIARHYADPRTGGVAGEKIVRDPEGETHVAGAGEGLYWKYESFLKKLDSEFGTVVGAAGELFSVRTALFEPVAENVLLDDFIISLRIAEKGYRIVYEPKAYAVEAPSFDIREEQKRKIRIGAGGFQSIVMLRSLLNVFRYPRLSFQYISHRVLRWAVCPFLLPVILLTNIAISVFMPGTFYDILLGLQVLFYLAAGVGYWQAVRGRKSKLFYIPFYFVFMNICIYAGLFRYWNNSQSVLWEKAVRKKENRVASVK